METKESWEEIKGKGRVGEFLILDVSPRLRDTLTREFWILYFFPHSRDTSPRLRDALTRAFAWIGEEILTQRTQWEVGGRGHYGFMHNVEMCWKLDFDL